MAEVNVEEMSILREHDIAIVSVADAENISSDTIASAGPEATEFTEHKRNNGEESYLMKFSVQISNCSVVVLY